MTPLDQDLPRRPRITAAILAREFRDELMNGMAEQNKKLETIQNDVHMIKQCQTEQEKKQNTFAIELAVLQVKAGVWGILGGVMTLIAGYVLKILFASASASIIKP